MDYGLGSYTVAPFGLRGNIWRYAVGLNHSAPDFASAHEHPAIFPLALARDRIATWTKPGDIVLDQMAGSGTTMRAAADLQRDAIGIEIYQPLPRTHPTSNEPTDDGRRGLEFSRKEIRQKLASHGCHDLSYPFPFP